MFLMQLLSQSISAGKLTSIRASLAVETLFPCDGCNQMILSRERQTLCWRVRARGSRRVFSKSATGEKAVACSKTFQILLALFPPGRTLQSLQL